jgi:hypothetical protein
MKKTRVLCLLLAIGLLAGTVVASSLYKIEESRGVVLTVGTAFSFNLVYIGTDVSNHYGSNPASFTPCSQSNSTTWTCPNPSGTHYSGENITFIFQIQSNKPSPLTPTVQVSTGGFSGLTTSYAQQALTSSWALTGTYYTSPQPMSPGTFWDIFSTLTISNSATAGSATINAGVYGS